MRDDGIGRVEDYTSAFLGAFYLILVMGLVVIWGIWSYAVALAICWALHAGIRRVGLHRARAEAEWEARVAASIARARGL